MTKIAESGYTSQRHGSADPVPDPYQNVMDPQHWKPLLRIHTDMGLLNPSSINKLAEKNFFDTDPDPEPTFQ